MASIKGVGRAIKDTTQPDVDLDERQEYLVGAQIILNDIRTTYDEEDFAELETDQLRYVQSQLGQVGIYMSMVDEEEIVEKMAKAVSSLERVLIEREENDDKVEVWRQEVGACFDIYGAVTTDPARKL